MVKGGLGDELRSARKASPGSLPRLHPGLPGLKPWRRLWLALALVLVQAFLLAPARAQVGGGSFDHSATTYPLLGKHEEVRCETCRDATCRPPSPATAATP